MSLSCHSPSWQWLPECCWQQTRQIRSDGAGSGSERFVFKIGMPGRLPWFPIWGKPNVVHHYIRAIRSQWRPPECHMPVCVVWYPPLQSASLNALIASFSTFLHNGHWASAEESQNSCADCPCTVCLHDFLETSFELAELTSHFFLLLNTCLRQTEVPFVEMEVDTGMPGRHRTATTGDRRSPFVQVLWYSDEER